MFNKKYKEQIAELQKANEELKSTVEKLTDENNNVKVINRTLLTRMSNLEARYKDNIEYDNVLVNLTQTKSVLEHYKSDIEDNKELLKSIEDDILTADTKLNLQIMGMYDLIMPKYSTEEYKQKITESRTKRSDMLNDKSYYKVDKSIRWVCNGSEDEGAKFIDFLTKQCISSFNLTVDALIDKITISNIDRLKKRVTKIFTNLNKILHGYHITLSDHYLKLVLEELNYKYELEIKKQQDKEEREYQKMLIKEQEAAEKEITKQHEQLLKEREKYETQLSKGKNVQDKIEEIDKAIENNEYRKEHTLAGYVYIINNPSLGKDVYKIGVTRRPKWEDRINELSNASVPFRFTPNCVLFSENAFALETALHKEFNQYRVNKVNRHKEYFNVKLEEIEKVVKEKYDKDAVFDYEAIDPSYLIGEVVEDKGCV